MNVPEQATALENLVRHESRPAPTIAETAADLWSELASAHREIALLQQALDDLASGPILGAWACKLAAIWGDPFLGAWACKLAAIWGDPLIVHSSAEAWARNGRTGCAVLSWDHPDLCYLMWLTPDSRVLVPDDQTAERVLAVARAGGIEGLNIRVMEGSRVAA